ncbi:hypothetical protein HZY83_04830 [Gemella sp. GH3]|uniref:YdjY domain-containing protein n=1 Tax=unclassified Gemella TaxID=2624949 RepID=UPI0015D0CD9C|nr:MULTISPECIES: YdjY domain-containing protein [unclassified Gemella]MBF0714007.1 hypothetical protein [Gemella sp. GH3.1]NYS50959.1 hypothetical protein [Gemella sp. GH3]
MKLFRMIPLAIISVLTLTTVGCSSQDSSKSNSEQKSPDQVLGVSLSNPIKVDKEKGTVTVLSQVNGKYFNQTTRHASVEQSGSNGAKSVLTAFAKPEEFYNALNEISAKEGGNMTPANAANTHVEGTPIKMEVTWNGADRLYDINDIIKDSNGKKIAFRFGGNKDRANEKNTGCLSCLDSCPVGIISNETYTYGAVESTGEVKFTGNSDLLPEDGTYVATVYSIDKDRI